MLREIRDLGFESAELSHGIRISLLPGIYEAVEAGEIKIATLHNFCPLPMGVNHAAPNLFRFSALDQRERDNAFRHSLKTIETAARLKASLVVLHLGSIEMKDYTRKLIEMVAEGRHGTPKYEKLCTRALERRAAKKEKYVKAASEMLARLVEEAKVRGVRLGIENREGVEEIPFEEDLAFLFKDFPDPTVGYWHDTGHAQIKENLGFIHHALHLESLADRLQGFHIHDVLPPATDHLPPGEGAIDFVALKPFVKPEHLKVFEFNPALPPEAILAGVEHIKKLWGPE
jgi:sugar phosphate isomerase/epimerase